MKLGTGPLFHAPSIHIITHGRKKQSPLLNFEKAGSVNLEGAWFRRYRFDGGTVWIAARSVGSSGKDLPAVGVNPVFILCHAAFKVNLVPGGTGIAL